MIMAKKQIPVLDQYEYQRPVIDKDLSIPPTSPVRGDRYIVGINPTGDWENHYRHIAECSSISPVIWEFTIPRRNMIIPVDDETKYYFFGNNKWQDLSLVLSGKRIVEQIQENKELTLEDSGKVFSSQGSTECVYTLPLGTDTNDVGINYTFIRAGLGKLTIEATGSDRIADSTSTGIIYSDAENEECTSLTLILAKEEHWTIVAGHGTWTTII